jgi:hypothetical protein
MVATRRRWSWVLAVLSLTGALQAADGSSDAPAPAPETTSLPSEEDARGPTTERERQAEVRRLRALRFWDLRSFPAAREELLAAYELSPRPLFLYNLAVASMALGDSAGAYDYFERYLRQGDRSAGPERLAMVERQLQDLAEHVATLHVSADVTGAQVLLDGKPVATTPLLRPLRLNVGVHSLTVRRAEASPETRRIAVHGGQSLQLHFAVLAQERRKAAETKRTRWLVAGWTSTAVLGAGGAFAGWRALVAHDSYRAAIGQIDTSRAQLDEMNAKAMRWSVTADALALGAVAAGACSLYLTFKPLGPELGTSEASATADVRVLRVGISSRAAYVAGSF